MTAASTPSAPISAMLLAAGRGERMRPLTDTCPKPLLQVQGKPLMQWPLEALAQGGFGPIVINTAWLGEQIAQQFGSLDSGFGSLGVMQPAFRHRLDQHVVHSSVPAKLANPIIGIGGQCDDAVARLFVLRLPLAYLPRGLIAIKARHVQIHEDQRGRLAAEDGFESFLPIASQDRRDIKSAQPHCHQALMVDVVLYQQHALRLVIRAALCPNPGKDVVLTHAAL